ncbi:ABC transporter permease [Rhodococcus globerulus]|nr:ABC transporter permease [Rhodococcus globerulus]
MLILLQPSLILSGLVVLVVAGWWVSPSTFTRLSPYESDSDHGFSPPSLDHPFGTDRIGRDLYARVVYGAANTVEAALIAVFIGLVLGSLIGLLSGSLGGAFDTVVTRIVDVLLSLPSLLLSMVVVAATGYGMVNIAIAVGIASIATFARVMRSEVLRVARSQFVEAAGTLGVGYWRVLATHVLPNSARPVVALAALELGTSILAVSSLGFLGYGLQAPEPEWGLSVSEGRDYLASYPWIALLPGVVIVLVVLSANRIGKSLGEIR